MSKKENILLLKIDHIVFDRWSLSIFLREISILYQFFSIRKTSTLTALSTQYSDYALWQTKQLESKFFQELLIQRTKRLSGASPLFKSPTIKTQTCSSALQEFRLSPSLLKALNNLSVTYSVTLFIILMAVFQLLLYQYTGKEDICVAAPFSNRVRKEFSEVIGYFSGNQIIRINFSGNPTLQELLNQVRKIVLEAYSYQEIPSLLAKLKPLEWNDNYRALSDVMFDLYYESSQPLSIPNLRSKYMSINLGVIDLALLLSIRVSPGKLSGFFEYRTDLFSADLITQMVNNFIFLLNSVIQNPEIKVDDLSGKFNCPINLKSCDLHHKMSF